MTTQTIDPQRDSVMFGARSPYLWLGVGALLWFFAGGGRWDLPLAAWLFSVFLLRFSRMSRPLVAIGSVWLVSIAAAQFWLWQMAAPIQASTIAAGVLFGTVYALSYVLDRLFVRHLNTVAGLFLFPAALVVCEFLMGVFSPFGAGYGLRAVTQHANLPLLQITSVTGPYGIGFLIGWFATVANWVWENPSAWRKSRIVWTYAAVLAVVLLGGGARLAFFPSHGDTVSVAGISPSMTVIADAQRKIGGDLPPYMQLVPHGDPAQVRAAFGLVNGELLANTRRAAEAGAKIVFWSENAAVLLGGDEAAFLAEASAVARQERIYLNLGEHIYLSKAPYGRDQTRLIGPDGKLLWTYQKAHPIPGLETYIPGERKAAVVETPYGRLANVICYDADFPAMMGAEADIMLVPGGDWPEMGRVHTLGMARLRAIENGYALVRQDFNGLSAGFDRQGHVLAAQDTTGPAHHIMIVDVPVRGSATVYRSIGDVFAWACVAGTLLLSGMGIFNRRSCVR
ncbi:MAG TPA: nitrilase-related carbon-nitrogen hydrolase [Parvibaculum sp.]|jgi:apolipoprotein N-acyltransferase